MNGCLNPPIPLTCIPVFATRIIDALLALAGSVALILIIVGGIRWITSQGDPKALAQARTTLTYAIIGLFLVLTSFLILNIIGEILGINLTTFNISF